MSGARSTRRATWTPSSQPPREHGSDALGVGRAFVVRERCAVPWNVFNDLEFSDSEDTALGGAVSEFSGRNGGHFGPWICSG